jgi:hypothetical protein
MGISVASFEPRTFAAEQPALAAAAAWLAVSPSEALLLAPSQPFLRYGCWRAFVAVRAGQPAARLVASLDPRQRSADGPIGAIGFLAECGDAEALEAAFDAAESWLRAGGAALVRCPLQLTTWFGHRTVTDSFAGQGGPPPFALEPSGSPALVELLERRGFSAAHRAVSHLVEHDAAIAGARRGLERLEAGEFRHRPLDLGRLEAELGLLHRLVSATFNTSWGYSPISLDEFASLYRPLAGLVDPALVRFVEDADGQAVGFLFTLPADFGRGAALECGPIVIKTLGVLPEARRGCPGLGNGLLAVVHQFAAERGYPRAIHALMAEGSYAQRTSAGWGSRLRTYATFEQPLGSEAA